MLHVVFDAKTRQPSQSEKSTASITSSTLNDETLQKVSMDELVAI